MTDDAAVAFPAQDEVDADGEAEDTGQPDDAAADTEGTGDTGDTDEAAEPESDAAARFAALVEDRVRRLRYSHGLVRAVYTTEEEAVLAVVERRAALWVPTFTLLALAGSAVAALVLATRVGHDPQQQSGAAFWIVLGAVLLLGASFLTLFRSEVHFERLRPRGRLVRADVADAYDAVRDAPRRFVDLGADAAVLTRVSGLQPIAEQLVDALAAYHAGGGRLERAHPAYDRILRMRAEVDVLAGLIRDEARPDGAADTAASLPRPEQIADYDSLVDLATVLE